MTSHPKRNPLAGHEAFTLIELLVVLTILAILATMLLPALAGTRSNSQIAQCLNDKRQLSVAWLMYAEENFDFFISNTSWIPSSPGMDWTSSSYNTNTALLADPAQATIALYVKSASLFKCPADNYQSPANPGPRVRSISLNGVLAGFLGSAGPTVQGSAPGNGQYFGRSGITTSAGNCRKMTDLAKPGPVNIFLILDEHPDSINDGSFLLDPGYAPGSEKWRDLPASYHNGAAGISFTDGHAEMHAWKQITGANKTVYPVTMTHSLPWQFVNTGVSADYEWLNAGMPYR